MIIQNKSNYPLELDNSNILKTVIDSCVSKITVDIKPFDSNDPETYDWENGLGSIFLDDTSIWPDSGYVTVYLSGNFLEASKRACMFHFSSKDDFALRNVQIMPNQSLKYFPLNSVAILQVVAQHHNLNREAILNLENYLGNVGTENQNTIEWFTNFFVKNVRIPKPWIKIDGNVFSTEEYISFIDLTSRIKPGFESNEDSTVEWIFQFGDGSKAEISLDVESKKYIIKTIKVQQDGTIVEKIKKQDAWNKELKYRYNNPGVYNFSLTVKNEFGIDTLEIVDAIKIISKIPDSLDISVRGSHVDANRSGIYRVKSLSEQVLIYSELKSDFDFEVKKYVWKIPQIDQSIIPNSAYLNLSFDSGGMYDVGLKVIMKNDSWISALLKQQIDVVEKPSIWLMYSSSTKGYFSNNEFSPRSNSWKEYQPYFQTDMIVDFDLLKNGIDYSKDSAFHSLVNSEKIILFHNISSKEINVMSFDTLVNSYEKQIDQPDLKYFNWYSLYMPVFNSNRVYILGGIKSQYDYSEINQEIKYYDINTKSFILVEQEFVLPSNNNENKKSYTTAFENAQSMLTNADSMPAKWKTANYLGKGYIFKNTDSGLLDGFYIFDPSRNSFSSIPVSIPFSKKEFAFNALNNGLFVISNAGDVFRYEPLSNIWSTTTSSSNSDFANIFHISGVGSKNPDARVISGTESKTINASNTKMYFSFDYSLDSFGRFDLDTLSFQKMPPRNAYPEENQMTQWGMTIS